MNTEESPEEKLIKLIELNTAEYKKALAENKALSTKNKALKSILEIAMEDLSDSRNCGTCLYLNDMSTLCNQCMGGSNYKWRGHDRAEKLCEDE